ncbi:MAG: helix-hairpin-helix domain-containing protein, partial [Gammaproteobacteria bacterium]|nr:helix-hairpin-helix domain-containing protein [Gammaproteobacteria bacterium]
MQSLNHEIAKKLRDIAVLLKAQKANPFRVNAYLHAADTLDNLPRSVADLMQDEGIEGLVALPGIGEGIARSIYEYVATGRMSRLENLKGAADPVELFRSIPTVGRALAERIHDTLHVDSLEALETAVRNGQLEQVDGLGRKRREAIEAWLQKHLDDQRRQLRQARGDGATPEIRLVLKVDEEYRRKAAAGKLPMITPKRFNPENRAWLPILHSTHDH